MFLTVILDRRSIRKIIRAEGLIPRCRLKLRCEAASGLLIRRASCELQFPAHYVLFFRAHAAFGALRGVPAEGAADDRMNGAKGCLKSRLLFRQPVEFKIKSLYCNDLILNIAYKIKEAVQKLKFLDSRERTLLGFTL